MIVDVKRTERGWAGHFICANSCRFRRNTLLERGDVRIVVSTVGAYESPKIPGVKPRGGGILTEIGWERFFETMAFHAQFESGRYWDADVRRQVYFDAPWSIAEWDADDKANDMHEAVVNEITGKLIEGNEFKSESVEEP